MSIIDDCIKTIKSAVYGKDVRKALADAFEYLGKNMSGVYTLPAASDTELGGIKLSSDMYMDAEKRLHLKSITAKVVNVSDTENTALYEALNKLGTKAHIITSESKTSGNETMILEICISADGYAIPVYRIFNGTVWTGYIRLTGYGLSSDFQINKNSELQISSLFKLTILSMIQTAMEPEDISEDLGVLNSQFCTGCETIVSAARSGNVISGTICIAGSLPLSEASFNNGGAKLFAISEAYKPHQSLLIPDSKLINATENTVEESLVIVDGCDVILNTNCTASESAIYVSFNYIVASETEG